MPELSGEQIHRAAGVLLAMAAGDALGAGYEFGGPYPDDMPVSMKGGGAFDWQPGEWTDDTQMALVIADAAMAGADLREESTLDAIAVGWVRWMESAADVGAQTRTVLSALGNSGSLTAGQLLIESERLHRITGHTAGNGSLMRTAPVALAYLDDPDGLTEAAETISQLTHYDTEAAEACVLWCHLIRNAVLSGEVNTEAALSTLSPARSAVWSARLETAVAMRPSEFTANGWVVEALQAAWCAIITTAEPESDAGHLRRALEAAVRGGRDADTVAAIAGGLLGAIYGASAVPASWRRMLHGWPGLRARDLIARSVLIARGGEADGSGWPLAPEVDYARYPGVDTLIRHPHDDGVWLGGVASLRRMPEEVDAVVSLCRLGAAEVPADRVDVEDHVEVWLVDTTNPADNPHLEFVLQDTASLVAQLRADGKTVLVHCVQAQSRTPIVAALHSVGLGIPVEEALEGVCSVLPDAAPNAAFRAALARFADAG